MPLLERMREGRKSPQVLNVKLLAIRSSRPNAIVFIFESHDDVSVFADWIGRVPEKPRYEPVAGNGKEQLLAFQLMLEQDERLSGVYFFVDHDYDENQPLEHVFVLRAYSFENLLCVDDVIDSILIDELRCAGDPETRRKVIATYRQIVSRFREISSPLHETLFIARREGFRVESRPDDVADYLNIGLEDVTPNFSKLDEIVEVNIELSTEKLHVHKMAFLALEPFHSVRGKYALQAMRIWLRMLTEDRRSDNPRLFPRLEGRLSGSPDQATLRRLASATPVPAGLFEFLHEVVA
ncbi:hypothetical protein XarbCFBP8138_10140 [Xanthomonas arboricola]|uniref:DUF4435 domain-containing protein n=1 Tax=Xanthomonas arboricola TaxID=56448 RepID=UPI000CEEFF15|nr:DUF4435 domain-containing protein [Xanthomonas arboricola]PPT56049.1 hypothetical protein XarbCFBP8138_10140 [Xanthomonas arboricola]